MVKGVSVKFQSYEETIPKFMDFIKFEQQLIGKKLIILHPSIGNSGSHNTSTTFVEEIIRYCLSNMDEDAKIIIVAGADGEDTFDVFEEIGYTRLAEHYPVSLVDLNTSEVDEIENPNFIKFESIFYPKILREGYLISLPRLNSDEETEIQGAISSLIGAYPASHYKGFFSKSKSKIRKWPIKYSIHDISNCRLPDAVIMDASDYGHILAGRHALDVDKQASKLIGREWKSIQHLRLLDESLEKLRQDEEYKERQRQTKETSITITE